MGEGEVSEKNVFIEVHWLKSLKVMPSLGALSTAAAAAAAVVAVVAATV